MAPIFFYRFSSPRLQYAEGRQKDTWLDVTDDGSNIIRFYSHNHTLDDTGDSGHVYWFEGE
ncbi:pre-pilin like leader sequence [Anopheles sinensis]|uniref:Pre-pilin like leader sequence n=1 Tax=Anopheles sinensis TaxID=74873 RepID=A0A084VR13_ANOSI|nr:pre-pilin like leader sequence [Anopheles sinensis]